MPWRGKERRKGWRIRRAVLKRYPSEQRKHLCCTFTQECRKRGEGLLPPLVPCSPKNAICTATGGCESFCLRMVVDTGAATVPLSRFSLLPAHHLVGLWGERRKVDTFHGLAEEQNARHVRAPAAHHVGVEDDTRALGRIGMKNFTLFALFWVFFCAASFHLAASPDAARRRPEPFTE